MARSQADAKRSNGGLRLTKAIQDKGMLKINLAKKAEAKPKQIKVNVGQETLTCWRQS